MTKKDRPKVGFFGITGCAGCQLSVIFNEKELLRLFEIIDVTAFPFVKDRNVDGGFDFVFVEGLVASNTDLKTLKHLRENAKVLVALGACAHTGCIPAYRKYTLKEDYAHLLYSKDTLIADLEPTPIDAHVTVDYTIPGCPPDKHEIIAFIKDITAGKKPKPFNNPVCIECRQHNNMCLLEVNKPCLGPITRGGCDAVCINGGFECWGCRGPTDDANMPAFVNMQVRKGHSKEFLKGRMRSFVGLKIPKEWEELLNAK